MVDLVVSDIYITQLSQAMNSPSVPTAVGKRKISIEKNKEKIEKYICLFLFIDILSAWYCLPDSHPLLIYNPETSSRVTLALLGIVFQTNLIASVVGLLVVGSRFSVVGWYCLPDKSYCVGSWVIGCWFSVFGCWFSVVGWYCLPDSRPLLIYNPETSSRVTLALLGIVFQTKLPTTNNPQPITNTPQPTE